MSLRNEYAGAINWLFNNELIRQRKKIVILRERGNHQNTNRKTIMRNKLILVFAAFAVLLFGAGLRADAQVKRVEMRIGGYLCGN
jgi:hypothetical protein